jgi:hypothetical protein
LSRVRQPRAGPDWQSVSSPNDFAIQSRVILVPVPLRAVTLRFSDSDSVCVSVPSDATVADLHAMVVSYYSHFLEDGIDAQLAFWGKIPQEQDSVITQR